MKRQPIRVLRSEILHIESMCSCVVPANRYIIYILFIMNKVICISWLILDLWRNCVCDIYSKNERKRSIINLQATKTNITFYQRLRLRFAVAYCVYKVNAYEYIYISLCFVRNHLNEPFKPCDVVIVIVYACVDNLAKCSFKSETLHQNSSK